MDVKFKAVLFDLDGTLADTIGDITDAVNSALKKLRFPLLTEEQCRQMVGTGAESFIHSALPEHGRTPENFSFVLDAYLDYQDHHLKRTFPYDGMPQAVQALQDAGVRLAVVTNKREHLARGLMDSLYPGAFSVVFGDKPNQPAKPDPASSLRAMELLGVKPEECAFVGDSEVDMLTARACGARPIGVSWGYRPEEELWGNGAAAVASRPGELLPLLLG